MVNRYFLYLSYDGSAFHGWQLQDNAPTVQQFINEGLSALLKQEINVVGCGRTDAGVHARNFYAHFNLKVELSDLEQADIIFKLNRFLPKEIAIRNLQQVRPDAHARFDPVSRTYKYFIHRKKDPFLENRSYYLYGLIDIELMNEATKVMMQFTDFTSFSKLHTQTKTNDCKISQAIWEEKEHQLIFTITADRFLRNMVRAIVGTLLEVGRHKISLDEFKNVIESRNRSEAGYSVPAKALFLEDVEYPKEIWI